MAAATVDAFVEEFARALERRDDEGCAALGGAGEHLVDGDFEYVLRREGSGVLCHVGVNISAEPNLSALAGRRGYRPPA